MNLMDGMVIYGDNPGDGPSALRHRHWGIIILASVFWQVMRRSVVFFFLLPFLPGSRGPAGRVQWSARRVLKRVELRRRHGQVEHVCASRLSRFRGPADGNRPLQTRKRGQNDHWDTVGWPFNGFRGPIRVPGPEYSIPGLAAINCCPV